MTVWVSGSLAYDRIMDYQGRFADHINPKKLHIINLSFAAKTLNLSFGGCAGNIAYGLRRLGVKTGIVGNLGKDGGEYFKRLEKSGADLACVQVFKNAFTAGAYITTDRDDNQISAFYAGAMEQASRLPETGPSSLAIVAADAPLNMSRLCLYYQKRKLPYLYDPGQQITALSVPYLLQAMRSAWIIIGNDYEIDLIFKRTRYAVGSKQAVITTLGGKGSIIRVQDRLYKIPAVKPKQVADPTGAGDAYRAGLFAGLVKKLPWEDAGRLASTVAAYAVETQGTQNYTFSKKHVEQRFFNQFKKRLRI